jgi:predicted nucleic acid-binding protein
MRRPRRRNAAGRAAGSHAARHRKPSRAKRPFSVTLNIFESAARTRSQQALGVRLLADKSALVRLGVSPDAAQWASRIERGLVRVTTVTRLEVGFSARSGPDLRAGLRQPPLSAMPAEYLTPLIEDRAAEIQAVLADRGLHRPSIPDLIIAATAELAGLAVLHLDKDFDLIADVTGQPVEHLRVT